MGASMVLEVNARYGAHCALVPEVIDASQREREAPAPA